MATRRFQAALTPAACNTIVCAEQAFTVGPGGMNLDSQVSVTKPSINGAISCVQARVSSATQISVTFCNPTAGNITPTAGEVYQFTLVD